MAYSFYEETELNSPKSVQYYPEEYDYPSHYHKISEVKVNYSPIQSTKKTKTASSTINYINERKCPIYVHQYNKVQSISTYNNYPSRQTAKITTEKNILSKSKKIPGFPTTKSVLDQLEETYWATWKPNKENVGTVTKKNKVHGDTISKIKAYGDVPDNISNYYNSSEYDTSTVPVLEESDYEKFSKKYETVINIPEICESRKKSTRLKTTHTQEIQTESVPLELPKIMECAEVVEVVKTEVVKPKEPSAKTFEIKETPIEKTSDEEPVQENINGEKSKLLKHTDSFIINKKKQGEVKEHFQQPKCIRLYRKPGISTSFIRGGTYPLKSCLKRETVQKGNFRLGAPGSPLFVSTSSFHKKNKK